MFKQDGKEEYTPEQVQKAKDYCLGKDVKNAEPKAKKPAKKKSAPLLPALGDTLEPTISINGGPAVPMSMVKKALELIKGEKLNLSVTSGPDVFEQEARRALQRVYGDLPVPEAEVQELAASVRESLTGTRGSNVRPGGIENGKLKSYIERIERLTEEKTGLGNDITDIFSEAKSNGMDVKTMRQILKLRKMKTNDRTEQEYLLELYKRALGMQSAFDFAEEEEA